MKNDIVANTRKILSENENYGVHSGFDTGRKSSKASESPFKPSLINKKAHTAHGDQARVKYLAKQALEKMKKKIVEEENIQELKLRNIIPGLGKKEAKERLKFHSGVIGLYGDDMNKDQKFRHMRSARRYHKISLGKKPFKPYNEENILEAATGFGDALKPGEHGLVKHSETASGKKVSYYAAKNKKGELKHFGGKDGKERALKHAGQKEIKEENKNFKFKNHVFKTDKNANLGLDNDSEYEVIGYKSKHTPFGNFSHTTVKNTKNGKKHDIPTGNAQLIGYLPKID